MGIKRGAYERAQRGGLTRPSQVATHVPSLPVGAGMSAMAGAMKDKARAEKEKWNVKPMFDAMQRVILAYDSVKDRQYERAMAAAASLKEYEHSVNSGKEQFNPEVYLVKTREMQMRMNAYNAFGIDKYVTDDKTAKSIYDTTADFMENRASKVVTDSWAKRIEAQNRAEEAAMQIDLKDGAEIDYSGMED